MSMQTGFIGLGAMGLPMARNLLAAGVALRVFNRTADRCRPLEDLGAVRAGSVAEACAPGGIAVTMLADDAALEAVTQGPGGLALALGKGGVHLSMSTVSPATAKRLAALHAERGGHYVAAPVFGRPEAAAARKLWICAAGDADAKARVRPVLEAMGQGVFDFGDEPAAANVVKLAGNFLIVAALEAMAEAQAMAAKNGVDPLRLAEMLGQTLFACPVYANYGRQIAERRFDPPGFRLRLGLKDVNLVLGLGGASGVPMPLASLARDRLLAATARGRGDMDWAALALGAAEDAGLPEKI